MSRILMVASEATPFAKTGGLADVVGALPAVLQEIGHEVAVVMPRYRSIPWEETESAFPEMVVFAGQHAHRAGIRTKVHRGVRFYFVDAPQFFDRDGLYDHYGSAFGDNHVRYAVFSLAALGVAQTVWPCDILHCHDWQAALAILYRHDQQWGNPRFFGVRTVLTLHNLGYQGRFAMGAFDALGLNRGWLSMDKLEFHGDINLLKGAIMMADAITTVSPRYAQEIQTPGMGHGLDGVLRARARHLTGILNGVDYGEWNPETDPHLAANYSAADLAGKRDCKRELLREFALPDDNLERPLVGIVSRFAEQKGFDLVAGIAQEIADGDLQLAVLGTGDWRYERMFRDWAAWLPHKVGAWIGYNNAIAHKIEAGADMFLMPSHYEPCGLNQIYSLKYGTVPIVRATGGLDDTVDETTGFKFEHYSADGLVWALRQALAEYSTDRTGWRARQVRGMRKDFSWHASALQYSDLYQRLLA